MRNQSCSVLCYFFSLLLITNVASAGDLRVEGIVESQSIGYKFPDGSVQSTAARNLLGLNGATANSGLYGNQIADFSPPLAYTEVCIEDGSVLVDIHTIGEPTSGGNCEPGDLGWIMERNQRPSSIWANARMECLVDGMRLPEPFEWSYGCQNDTTLGLIDMTGDSEWVSNTVLVSFSNTGLTGLVVPTMGANTCASGDREWIARGDSVEVSEVFRCAK